MADTNKRLWADHIAHQAVRDYYFKSADDDDFLRWVYRTQAARMPGGGELGIWQKSLPAKGREQCEREIREWFAEYYYRATTADRLFVHWAYVRAAGRPAGQSEMLHWLGQLKSRSRQDCDKSIHRHFRSHETRVSPAQDFVVWVCARATGYRFQTVSYRQPREPCRGSEVSMRKIGGGPLLYLDAPTEVLSFENLKDHCIAGAVCGAAVAGGLGLAATGGIPGNIVGAVLAIAGCEKAIELVAKDTALIYDLWNEDDSANDVDLAEAARRYHEFEMSVEPDSWAPPVDSGMSTEPEPWDPDSE